MSLYVKAVVAGKTITGRGTKTVDPQYVEADKIFQVIKTDMEKIVGSLTMMESQFETLSKFVGIFGNDIETWYMDSPDNRQQLRSQTAAVFSHNFSLLTANFLNPRVEFNVTKKLAAYQNEVERLKRVQEMVELTRKQYDQTSTRYEYLIAERNDKVNANFLDRINPMSLIKPNLIELGQEIQTTQEQLNRDRAQYEQYNNDFITSVQKLSDTRKETLDKSFKNLICIMSQYMMKIFEDLQKFRTAFPSDCFIPKTDNQSKRMKEAVEKKSNRNNNDNDNDN